MTQAVAYTADQLDAVIDAQDVEPALAKMTTDEVAAELARRGSYPELFPPAAPEDPAAARRRERQAQREAAARLEAQAAADEEVYRAEKRAKGEAEAAARRTLEQARRAEERASSSAARELPVAQAPTGQRVVAAGRPPEGGLTIPGMEYVTRNMLTIPSLKLKQAQTRDKHRTGIDQVPDGVWFPTHDPTGAAARAKELAAAGEPAEREIVILEIRPGRSYMLPYDDDERYQRLDDLGLRDLVDAEISVVCSSPDRVQPSIFDDRQWEPFSSWCSECPSSSWRVTPSGGKTMDCGEVFRVLILDVTDELMTPARMFVSSSAIKPFRNAQTMLAIFCEPRSLPTWALRFKLGSKPVQWKKGQGFAPVWSTPQLIEDEALIATYGAIRAGLIDQVSVLAQGSADEQAGA